MMVFNTQFYINNFQPSFANDMPTFSSSSSMFKPYPLVIKFGNGTSTMLLPWSSQLKSNSIELEGFPIYFLSHICPIYFQSISPWLSCGFPMVFLWFSYGFPIQTPQKSGGACKRRLAASAPVALACARTASPEAQRAWQWGIFTTLWSFNIAIKNGDL